MPKFDLSLLFLAGFCLLLIIPSCRQTPTGAPDAQMILTPPPQAAFEMATAVAQATIPPRDPVKLTQMLRGINAPRVAATEATPYQVGDMAPFWYKNLDRQENVQIEAELRYRSATLNVWVEAGVFDSMKVI